jgi:hypothetical protein
MNTFEFDASKWNSVLDMCASLHVALKSPEGYGCSVMALFEAMVWDHADDPEYPSLTIRIFRIGDAPQAVRDQLLLIRGLVPEVLAEFRARDGRDFGLNFELS